MTRQTDDSLTHGGRFSIPGLIANRLPNRVRPLALALYDLLRAIRPLIAWRRSTGIQSHAAVVRLHIGCGSDIRKGWLNMDLRPPRDHDALAEVLIVDLRQGIPLEDAAAHTVYSSHFLEHLTPSEAVRHLRECHRVLAPGGRIRLVVPDFAACCQAYLAMNTPFFTLLDPLLAVSSPPGGVTIVDYMQVVAHQGGEHRSLYDEEKLARLLGGVGFIAPARVAFDPSLDLDTPERRRYSLYMEATRA